jgi:hypothetical protein
MTILDAVTRISAAQVSLRLGLAGDVSHAGRTWEC